MRAVFINSLKWLHLPVSLYLLIYFLRNVFIKMGHMHPFPDKWGKEGRGRKYFPVKENEIENV